MLFTDVASCYIQSALAGKHARLRVRNCRRGRPLGSAGTVMRMTTPAAENSARCLQYTQRSVHLVLSVRGLDVEGGLELQVVVLELPLPGEIAGRHRLNVTHLVLSAELGEVTLGLGLAHLSRHLQVLVHLARVEEGVLCGLGGVAEGGHDGQPQVVLDVLPVVLLGLELEGDGVLGVVDGDGPLLEVLGVAQVLAKLHVDGLLQGLGSHLGVHGLHLLLGHQLDGNLHDVGGQGVVRAHGHGGVVANIADHLETSFVCGWLEPERCGNLAVGLELLDAQLAGIEVALVEVQVCLATVKLDLRAGVQVGLASVHGADVTQVGGHFCRE
mmetsp:Transcript_34851/g.76176  ORF Transcript_34851/g.76176 Transcript_34851/m.76176 type:complete len:328 (+) Transcript_34851:42-1025(+)